MAGINHGNANFIKVFPLVAAVQSIWEIFTRAGWRSIRASKQFKRWRAGFFCSDGIELFFKYIFHENVKPEKNCKVI